MTIQRAREIYKEEFSHLTDEQVSDYIKNMSILCDELLEQSIKGLTSRTNNGNTKYIG
jgi:hypothetical protein